MSTHHCCVYYPPDAPLRECRRPWVKVWNCIKRTSLCKIVVRRSLVSTSIIHQVYLCCVTGILILFVTASCLYNRQLFESFRIANARGNAVWSSGISLDAGRECCGFVREFSFARDVESDC